MSVQHLPPPVDPNSAWSEPPPGRAPSRDERIPDLPARAALFVGGLLFLVAASIWAIVIVGRLADFLSGDCNLLACSNHTFGEHFRAYTEAFLGVLGVAAALHTAWLAERLFKGHRHFSELWRSGLVTIALFAAWLLLLS
jgi:hypothetical protein